MFFRYEALFQRIYHLQIHPVEELDLLAVGIEIRIGLANQILNRCAVRVGHGLIHQGESSLSVFGKDKVRVNIDDLPEKFSLFLQRLFRPLGFGDVNGGTDVAGELAIGLKAWHSMIQDPTIFTVISPQAVFHRELLPRVEGINVVLETVVKVLAVDALSPPIAKFLFQRTAGKVEPTFVEKV